MENLIKMMEGNFKIDYGSYIQAQKILSDYYGQRKNFGRMALDFLEVFLPENVGKARKYIAQCERQISKDADFVSDRTGSLGGM